MGGLFGECLRELEVRRPPSSKAPKTQVSGAQLGRGQEMTQRRTESETAQVGTEKEEGKKGP